jgi:hypothetical protein
MKAKLTKEFIKELKKNPHPSLDELAEINLARRSLAAPFKVATEKLKEVLETLPNKEYVFGEKKWWLKPYLGPRYIEIEQMEEAVTTLEAALPPKHLYAAMKLSLPELETQVADFKQIPKDSEDPEKHTAEKEVVALIGRFIKRDPDYKLDLG